MPSIIFSQNELSNFDDSIHKEWLITNGLGSYASSTILGINTRKYHALLVAALRPPGERTVCLSKLDEDVEVNESNYRLGANDFRNGIYPQGYLFLKQFTVSPFPTYNYVTNSVELQKTVFLPFEKNAVIALYSVKNKAGSDCKVKIFPLISYRHYHYVIDRQSSPVEFDQQNTDKDLTLTFSNPSATIISQAINGKFNASPQWIDSVYYREEENRGESSIDEGYQPGTFEFVIPKRSKKEFAITTAVDTNPTETKQAIKALGSTVNDIKDLLHQAADHRLTYLSNFYDNSKINVSDELNWILQAANDFIAKGLNEQQRFIIAGFQWFGSWGRDTFVSLPGLMLVTGRFSEARNVISDYAKYCRDGVIPNLIDDKTGEPMYNTVDGTLWFINSVLQYLKYTDDYDFIKSRLWETFTDIIENHKKGTINGIHVDNDGLLAHGPQLTWMDTVVNGEPYTPRAGKAVEVQALWYNTLRTVQFLAERFGHKKLAEDYYFMAETARKSFTEKFWNAQQNCLFDVISDGGPDYSVRPNQVIAGALDFNIIDKVRANQMVDFVQRELFTPAGLRTLPPNDSRYKGNYAGNREDRDRAYHSGSIWPWQTGPFTTAYLKAKGYSDVNRQYALYNFIRPLFSNKIRSGGLGTISELYDAENPYLSRGCIAQAWSVAEPLRAYVEDISLVRPKFERRVLSVSLSITA
ncbi:MAG: amylo-alpha-1,6-glucosidase [Candidatus Bathyarchaeia archaeon]